MLTTRGEMIMVRTSKVKARERTTRTMTSAMKKKKVQFDHEKDKKNEGCLQNKRKLKKIQDSMLQLS